MTIGCAPTEPSAATEAFEREDPEGEAPWAMQLVVRVERAAPPTHTAVCEATATAVVRLLSDQRAAPGGAWEAAVVRWNAGRIRKVVRRARGSSWDDSGALEHVLVQHAAAEVRAFPPGPTDQVPAALARLPVAGLVLTDVGARECPADEPPMLSLALTPRFALTTGKAAAQCGHAAQLAAMVLDSEVRARWVSRGVPVRLLRLTEHEWDQRLARSPVVITDAGFTEIPPGTRTALAWWS